MLMQSLLKKEFIVLDFETRSSVPIEKGHTAYLNCKSFKPLVLSFAHYKPLKEKQNPCFGYNSIRDIKPFLKSLIKFMENNYIVAHNVEFDFSVFQRLTGVDNSYFTRWIDTSTISCFGGGPPSLFMCSDFWNLNNRKAYGKDLIDILSVPYGRVSVPKKYKGIDLYDNARVDDFGNVFVEHPLLFKHFTEYCMCDVKSTRELFHLFFKNGLLNEYLEAKQPANAYLNFLRNKKGVNFNVPLIRKFNGVLTEAKNVFHKAAKKITKNKDFNLNSSQQVFSFLKVNGLNVLNTQKDTLNLVLNSEKNLSDKLKVFLRLRVGRPSIVLGKLERILKDSHEGVISNSIKHFEAFTGRFKSFGVNLLNFPRALNVDLDKICNEIDENEFIRKHKFDVDKIIGGLLRRCIIPHEGCVFYGGDFNQIELRLLLGASGHFKELKQMYEGWDAYKEMAASIYEKSVQDVTKEERYVAKRVVLARGYGLGVKGLVKTLFKDDIYVSEAQVMKLLNWYDNRFYKVKEFWNSKFLPFQGSLNKKDIKISIPFIRENLYFRSCDIQTDSYGNYVVTYLRGGGREILNPSSLCGLIIQSLALRLFHSVERNLYRKLKIVADIPIHDEFLCSVDAKKDYFKDFKKIIQEKPDWLPEKHFPFIQGTAYKGSTWGN